MVWYMPLVKKIVPPILGSTVKEKKNIYIINSTYKYIIKTHNNNDKCDRSLKYPIIIIMM
jgi:hypothetical protein